MAEAGSDAADTQHFHRMSVSNSAKIEMLRYVRTALAIAWLVGPDSVLLGSEVVRAVAVWSMRMACSKKN
jgi:hypothetical protein